MKTKLFLTVIAACSVFAFLVPEQVTEKVNIGGKALYGAEGYVVNRIKKATAPKSTAKITSLEIECDLPARPATITGPVSMCSGKTYTFTAAVVEGAESYEWILPEGWVGKSPTNVLTARAGEGGGDVMVRAVNACGKSELKHFSAMLSSSPLLPVISTDGTEFISSAPEGNQWYFESNPVEGATDNTFVPETEGKYHVCVTNRNSCSVCSEVIESTQLTVLSPAGDEEQDDGLIFPNPSTGMFSIKSPNCDDFIIYDSQGVLILSRKIDQDEIAVDLTWRPKGPYWVEFHCGTNTVTRKMLIN